MAFGKRSLWQEISTASGAPSEPQPDQVRYLASFLSHHAKPAKTLLVEKPYVDRHYLEEYAGYYATSLHAPAATTTRIHVFSEEITENKLKSFVESASENYSETRRLLESYYLGFIVVRPLPSAPIGRTVLRPYEDLAARCYEPARTTHTVHVAGFELNVVGLPFQQQDRAVGACATTAIWSALARVTRADGARAATPLSVTAAANKHVVSGRQLPADAGLDLNQKLAAIREFGFSPYVLSPRQENTMFQMALACYLRSGIPVILLLKLESIGELHAITAVGFRESDSDVPAPDLSIRLQHDFVLRAPGITRLYVHDDRLGPYARMVWVGVEDHEAEDGTKEWHLEFRPHDSGFEDFKDPAKIRNAIAPLYPKLRLTAEDLVGYAGGLLPLMRIVAGEELRDSLLAEPRFVHAGRYIKELYSLGLAPERIFGLATSVVLSRYVGVIRFKTGKDWFADVLCDTTDIRRDVPPSAPALAIIPKFDTNLKIFEQAAAAFNHAVVM